MHPGSTPRRSAGFWAWLNKRLPVEEFIKSQLTGYYAPKNFNIWYFFGSLALVVLVLQLVTGIFLTMFYKVGETTSFDSVEYIMREVDYGWLIRYLHSTGASAFFIVVYLHMFRAFLYGSYRKPRELLWLFGMAVYLALMAEAFMGYVLPWGNMSFWGAQVIVNLFGTIPGIGPGLVRVDPRRLRHRGCDAEPLLRAARGGHPAGAAAAGGAAPGGAAPAPARTTRTASRSRRSWGRTANRSTASPSIPTTRSRTCSGSGCSSCCSPSSCSSCRPSADCSSKRRTSSPANPLSTPEHIAPVWYFTPFYAILRAVPDQRMGALLMLLAVVSFLFMPWLDRSPVKSIRYKGWMSQAGADAVRDLLRGARLSRPAARRRVVRGAGAHFRGHLLRLLLADAGLHET